MKEIKKCSRHSDIFWSDCGECRENRETLLDKIAPWLGVLFFVILVIVAFTWQGWCLIHYWGTPWMDVPFYCHK